MTHRAPSPSHRWACMKACVLALPLAGSLQPAQAATSLAFLSSPYSYVGGGETVSAGPDNGFDIGVHGDPFTTLSFSIAEPWTPEGLSRYWNLERAAPEGASLSVGSYANATRWPLQETTAPGLAFSGNYRGNNILTGSFNILESSVSDDGTFSFAVDFVQYYEESTTSACTPLSHLFLSHSSADDGSPSGWDQPHSEADSSSVRQHAAQRGWFMPSNQSSGSVLGPQTMLM